MPKGAPRSYLPARQDPALLMWHFESDEFRDRYEALYQLLACGQADGKPRVPATLTLFTGEGRLKCVLTDKHTEQGFWLALDASGDILAQINQALVDGKGEWRPSKLGWVKR